MAQGVFPDGATADVLRGQSDAGYTAGDPQQPVTQTPEGRLRVDTQERLLGAIEKLSEDIRELHETLVFIHGL